MTLSKRMFDILAALVLLSILWPLAMGLSLWILLREGRPVLYLSERMKTPDQGFQLWKFRTMTVADRDEGVSGGHKASRITPTGAFLRKYRLDEIPQIWNVLRGDISFVGPRPPLRRYVDQFPELYGRVLRSRPGITGMATLVYHRHEEKLLAECSDAKQTEDVYRRRCVPQKARLDLIYQNRRTLCLDALLMLKTVFRRIKIH
ncbi:sugar transferase [Thalassovita sp.]|mgnify:CR=1 FL=1|jgi:lipopolysaccharide/colanic/teichoic acid biosynthesis glycosyltransferase|uniref:sugar transferase n=1 Tax=Thalassovita sp. TaxID=1979401 RepID=UPI003B5B1874